MYITKDFTDQYGHKGVKVLIPDVTENLQEDETTGDISCNFKLTAYLSTEDYEAGMKQVDCFRDERPVVTQDELNAAQGTTAGQKLKRAFTDKAMESVLDDEGNETNLFSGNIGEIGFQDATIV